MLPSFDISNMSLIIDRISKILDIYTTQLYIEYWKTRASLKGHLFATLGIQRRLVNKMTRPYEIGKSNSIDRFDIVIIVRPIRYHIFLHAAGLAWLAWLRKCSIDNLSVKYIHNRVEVSRWCRPILGSGLDWYFYFCWRSISPQGRGPLPTSGGGMTRPMIWTLSTILEV